jgi:hypothetical protein
MLKTVPGYDPRAAVIHSPVRRSDERSKTEGWRHSKGGDMHRE